MIELARTHEPLTPAGTRTRLALIAVTSAAALFLFAVDPVALSANWLPSVSCGAITGLPCIFCGLTRASHHLLHGEIGRALYFNWLVFPAFTAASIFCSVVTAEALLGRRLIIVRTSFRLTPRFAAVAGAGLLTLWAFQVWLAVAGHKTELLNPRGPLYALVVR